VINETTEDYGCARKLDDGGTVADSVGGFKWFFWL